MILKSVLLKIVLQQKENLKQKELGVKRDLFNKIDLNVPQAIILSGIRRCGKSVLLLQLMNKLTKYHYFNFEDPQSANFEVSDFEKLNDSFIEVNGECKYYFFDEIQNVEGWERFVRKLLDSGKKCVITGSNASLLSKELGTKLTGRHLSYELYPFSYSEMLKLKKLKPSKSSFEKYFINGGFPEFLKNQKNEYLHNLFNDILIRDVVVRHNINNSKLVKELAVYLLSNVGKEFSYNKLANVFNFGSTNTLVSYLSYFEDSYMFFLVPKLSYSYKKQLVGPKKIYCIDSGLANINSVSFSEDKGRILENLVFLKLKRKYTEIFYFKGKGECDFVVKDRGKLIMAIQVCYNLNKDNHLRELNGLKEAMQTFKIKKGVLVTYDQKDEIDNIKVVPLSKWKIHP